MAVWDTELRAVLKEHLEHESTINVVVAMYRSLRTAPRLIAGTVDRETAEEGGHALLEHAFVLNNNPFMAVFGSAMTAVYQMAVNAYTDSFHYYSQNADAKSAGTPESQAETLVRQQACRFAVHEITLMAVLCERGFGYQRTNSVAIRERLYGMKGVI